MRKMLATIIVPLVTLLIPQYVSQQQQPSIRQAYFNIIPNNEYYSAISFIETFSSVPNILKCTMKCFCYSSCQTAGYYPNELICSLYSGSLDNGTSSFAMNAQTIYFSIETMKTSSIDSTAALTSVTAETTVATTSDAPSSAITTTTGLTPNASNITWLMSTIQASNQTKIISSKPTFMAIDDQNYFVVLGYYGNLVQMNRTTMSVIAAANLGGHSGAVTYSNGYYFIGIKTTEKRHRLRIAFEWDDAQDGISSNILPTCRLLSLLTTDVGDTLILEEETRADADIISIQDVFMEEQGEDNDIMIVENAEDDDVVLTEWKCAGGDDDDIIFLEYKPASKRADI
ncbi:unnamed protein product [Didymodactylos carnosus]|uniref:Apple domain-containing protein n=1 Tax=Didymodactylos carnosus TaxID=1234261 RepID=A0A8S2J3U3_9BILA|nr:unnamed protein product [Didymodactylos carnosus]CAF3793369.1 unnamed protein product [Didymodactylos carnosus]